MSSPRAAITLKHSELKIKLSQNNLKFLFASFSLVIARRFWHIFANNFSILILKFSYLLPNFALMSLSQNLLWLSPLFSLNFLFMTLTTLCLSYTLCLLLLPVASARNPCWFCLLMCSKHIEECLEQSGHSINMYLNEWICLIGASKKIVDLSWKCSWEHHVITMESSIYCQQCFGWVRTSWKICSLGRTCLYSFPFQAICPSLCFIVKCMFISL